ncbi:MAG: acylase [Microscillaceae bacterium]|nr:acylase [Microscillaceae bacterium]
MKWMYHTLLIFWIFACSSPQQSTPELARWQNHAQNVTIIRDDFGVPHIYGKTDANAVFGLLYAQCEDDFKRVEQNYIWATGRLAELEGEEALYSDLRAHLFMTLDEARANYEKAPEWLKKLCQAFADGINYYLHTHPEVKPRLFTRFEPWMPMYFSEGSIGGDIERVSTEGIKAFYENRPSVTLNEYDDRHPDTFAEPQGSNGFAISGKLTQSGKAMLLINPHTSFYFRGEVHCVSEEGLNAYGAVTWGQFFIYQGFNEKTGWMHTSSYSDVMDEFVEKVSKKNDQYSYQYGQEQRKITEKKVTLKYKIGDELKEKTFTLYRTHHGPVTHKIDDRWVSTAMMWDPVNALIQSYTRTKKSGYKEFREMMNIRTNSSNNTVYADAQGNIAYFHGNFIPKRDTVFDFSKPVDGSNKATDWKGLHTVEECITLLNPQNGWLQNCNSTPFTAAAKYSPKPENYPLYMAVSPENFRGIHAQRVLKDVKNLTLDGLIRLAYDPVIPGFEQLIPGLIEAYNRKPDQNPMIKAAIDTLRTWDFKVSTSSVAMSLAHFYGLHCLREGKAPQDLNAMERVNYFGTDAPIEERLSLFKKTLEQLKADFGQWNTPWGEINRFQRLDGAIESHFDDQKPSLPVGLASGQWGALASYGARSFPNTKKIYGTSGNSFVAVVEFGAKVKAKSLLAGGQNGDPQSPHFYDQAQPYVDVKFKEVAFYEEDVKKRAKETYHPGERKK